MPRPPLQHRLPKIGRVARQGQALHAAHHVLLLVVGHPQWVGQRCTIQHEMVQCVEFWTDLPEDPSMLNRFVGQCVQRTVIHVVELLSSCADVTAQDRSSTAEGLSQLVQAHKHGSTQTIVPRAILDAFTPAHCSQPSDENNRLLH